MKLSVLYGGAALSAICYLSLMGVSKAEPVRLCTGSASAVYYDAGQSIRQMAGSATPVMVVETTGTIDNLNETLETGNCNAMIGQPDGPVYLARQSPAAVKKLRQVAGLHREYLHVLCNRNSGVKDLKDLADTKGKLAIGEPNSGAWLIWQNLVKVDKELENIPVSNEAGIMALSAASSGTDTVCLLVPAGLNTGTLKEADATFADSLMLVSAKVRNSDQVLGLDGKPIYAYQDIPADTYPNIQSGGWFSSSAKSTLSWNAGVYINTEAFTDPKQLQTFVTAVNRAAIGIKAEYGK
ncbi:C4-dicarboxylate ABC transporter substrate-binding protein [Brucella sp. HL-2]|nr:TAXI family TRAP transporter solute-binding subunit [Brucella sp. HL-2]MCV9910227.1 C4-dicarboxylate ABC transporter substrate-binding protein [Brucella sp. HL-2]